MQKPQPPSDWSASLQLLARLHPPASVVYVGDAPVSSPSRVWEGWGAAHTLHIHQTQAGIAPADISAAPIAGRRTVQAVLGEQAEQSVTVYQLSLQAESGLWPPQALHAIWPNLRTLANHPCVTTTLDITLNGCFETGFEPPNWLFLDPLHSLHILRGAQQALRHLQVVVARVALPPADTQELRSASVSAITSRLSEEGFLAVSVLESRNPMLGWVLFAKDTVTPLKTSIAARDALAQEKAELTQRLEAQTAAQQAESKAKAQLQAQLQTETQAKQTEAQAKAEAIKQRDAEATSKQAEATAKAEALKQRDALSQEKADLIAAHDALTQEKAELTQRLAAQTAAQQAESKAKAQLQAQLQAETQAKQTEAQAKAEAIKQRDAEATARQAEAKAKAEALKQCDALSQEKADLIAAHETLRKDKEALDADKQSLNAKLKALQTQFDELQQRLPALETENQELAQRQHLLQKELVKAEVQIELIKDLLLREPGL